MTATESSVITARLVFGLGGATLAFLMFFLVVFAGSVVYAVRPIRATPDAKVLG